MLTLRVSPAAKRSQLDGTYGGNAIKLRVAARPVDGKANAEVERFLAELLGVPRSDVALTRGASGRDKAVLVRGADPAEIRRVLAQHL